jgi:hypothetical protein
MKFWSDVQEKLGAGSIFNRVRTPSAEMRFHHMKKNTCSENQFTYI